MASSHDETCDTSKPLSVFLSYSREDRARALPIIRALEATTIRVWWDGLLEVGDAFAHTTETALETADAVVVLWSARSVQSHWVRDEATRGRDRGCMVPVSLDGTQPPLGFRQIQYVDLQKWRGKPTAPEFTEVLRAIRGAAQAPRTQLTFNEALPPVGRFARRHALALGGGTIAALGGALMAWRSGLLGGAQESNSVAVLPFKNLSGDPSQDYFSDGLSEELRATLSLNRQIEVAAEISSNSFRDKNEDAKKVAETLNVSFILEGSVRRSADLFRIAVQLIDGKTGFGKWSQSFDRKLADVLTVQSEIAAIVTDALMVRISSGSPAGGKRIGGTRNSEAFDAYLRGMALYKLGDSEETDRKALADFDRAVQLDPGYAAAHAARSRSLNFIGSAYARGAEARAYYEKAIRAANEAIRLASELAEGYAALGFVLMNGRLDMQAAQAPYRKAFELGFGNAGILIGYAEFAALMGLYDDGRRAIARAERLDPLNPSVFRSAGILEFARRDFKAATPRLNRALSLNPKAASVNGILADIELLQGKLTEARALYEKEANPLVRLRGLAIVDMRLSGQPAAKRQFSALTSQYGDNSLYQQAEVMAQWGKRNEALALLEQALTTGDAGLVLARMDPLLDTIRQEPRFQAILGRLGFDRA